LVGTFLTVDLVIEVVRFTFTGWGIDSVWSTDGTVVTFGFTELTLSSTFNNEGRTDWNFLNFDGFGGWFWSNTHWWVN